MLPIILVALGLLLMAGIIHLILAHVRFVDRLNVVEALLPDASFVEGVLMIRDLAELAWHRSHNNKVNQLYAYLKGKHNIKESSIVI